MGLIHIFDKMSRSIPLMKLIKQFVFLVRWMLYKHRVIKYQTIYRSSIEPEILVSMNAGIGNAIEATPLVQSIRIFWPKANITIYLQVKDLFDNWPVANHIAITKEELKGQSFAHTFIAWGAGGVSKFNGICKLGNVHYTEEPLEIKCKKPEREYNMDMLRRIGYTGPTPALYVSTQKPEINIPSSTLKICLVPGSKTNYKFRNKRWPYFEQLGRQLLEKYSNATLYIIGTKDDQVSDQLLQSSRVIDLRSRLNLAETAGFLKQSELAIGNDCGPMHIANAVQTASIIIFGPSCEIKNGPTINNKFITIRHEIPCAPCQYDKKFLTCNNPICMTELKPELIFEQANSFLKANGSLSNSLKSEN